MSGFERKNSSLFGVNAEKKVAFIVYEKCCFKQKTSLSPYSQSFGS
jgi:hypothetical protein